MHSCTSPWRPLRDARKIPRDPPVNLCIVHGDVSPTSGSGRYMADLATRFAEEGCRVTLLCFHCDELLDGIPNLQIVRLPRAAETRGLWRLGSIRQLRAVRAAVPRALGGRHFDVLIGSDLLFIDAVRRFCGPSLRFIYTPMSMIAPLEIRSYELGGLRGMLDVNLYHWLQRSALRSCDCVVRYTESGVSALERYYGIDLRHKALVSIYVPRAFEPTAADMSAPDLARPIPREIAWVGSLIKSKNVAFLLRAVQRLRSDDWIFTVCGDGPERRRLEILAADLGIQSRVRFLGEVRHMAEQYRRMSILLSASILEQYGLTFREAYAFGTPCIGIRPDWKRIFNINDEQILDCDTGYLISDEKEMAERIDYLLQHENERQLMGARGYELKKRELSFEKFFQQLKAIAIPG